MVNSITEPVMRALAEGGLRVFGEFPARPRDKHGPFVVVGLRSYKCLGSGLGEYLGIREKDNGEIVELYGKRLEPELLFEVYAPIKGAADAGECSRAASRLGELTEGFPAGLRPVEYSIGEISCDEELGCFRCECVLKCQAFLVAEAGSQPGEFTDFVLKGVIANGN
jgi:hypothetical protein